MALAAPREEGEWEEGEGEERGLNSSFPWVGKLRPVSCSSFFFSSSQRGRHLLVGTSSLAS